MRGFWQGIMIGGLAGVFLGLMAAPRLEEEMDGPLGERSRQLGSTALRVIQGLQAGIMDMWQKRQRG